MIQIVQLHGTDKKLYELVAPLVMSPEVLKQNYNYPFRTSEEYEWFVAPVSYTHLPCVLSFVSGERFFLSGFGVVTGFISCE